MRVIVLGGYGFIGAEIVRALVRDGHEVIGLGRSAATGKRLLPEIRWIGADMARLDTSEKWEAHLQGIDAVVNAAGALQEGPRDRLSAIHHMSIVACRDAMVKAGIRRFVQISAVGATISASTGFMGSKAHGDAAIKASALDWIIFRPGLVIGRNAYGGTALLRMLAAMPFVEAIAFPNARVQTVSIDDVTDAVVRSLKGEVKARTDYDLVEDEPQCLRETVRAIRRWQGFPDPALSIDVPARLARLISWSADFAGVLGWRSPLRSTAMRVLSENVIGDPASWRRAAGRPLKSLDETLRDMPATMQERIYARASLALPFMVATLGLFWIASGVIGLAELDRAAAHLSALGESTSEALVISASFVDIAIGAGVVWRPSARRACVASLFVSAVYLVAGTITGPELWLDPFGALVKIFPAMALAAATALVLEER
jgi:uncharacterized protein YbjT (DUF2867 family)